MKPIRMWIGTLGLDQHEVGATAVARLLREKGVAAVFGPTAPVEDVPATIRRLVPTS